MFETQIAFCQHKPGKTESLCGRFLIYPNDQLDRPAVLGDQSAHQQSSDHPTDSKDGHGEGVQDGEELLV